MASQSTPAPASSPASPAQRRKPIDADPTRETVESVVVAFILAFLFRTFEAEAFVIPTGSMAPTLYGQHRDVICEKCGVRFASGASDELSHPQGYIQEVDRTHTAVCPNCRFPNFVYEDEIFTGDRILVSKFPYDYWDPKPFDVVVFKYPTEPKTNYIKRMIGLPGQEVKIEDGDVFARPLGSNKPWQILRKAPDKQRDLQMIVYDDDYPPRDLLAAGWPERWQVSGQWQRTREAQARSLRVDPSPTSPDEWQWLRYAHLVPDTEAWESVRGKRPIVSPPAPLLISDNCGYNSRITVSEAESESPPAGKFPAETDKYPTLGRGAPPPRSDSVTGILWVGDLTVSCEVEVLNPTGQLLWELVEGSRNYRAELDLATGNVSFSYLLHDSDGAAPEVVKLGQQPVQSPIKGAGKYRVQFANVDDRLCFWVNETLVKAFEFNPEAMDGKLSPVRPVRPTARDLSPASIGARGASAIVSHLKLERDIYYRAIPAEGLPRMSSDPTSAVSVEALAENAGQHPLAKNLFPFRTEKDLADLQGDQALNSRQRAEFALRATLADPETWNKTFSSYLQGLGKVYALNDSADDAEDEFLVLGDNSPRSSDSRYWDELRFVEHQHAVTRKLLIGKAFFIYWPHAVPFLNDGKGIRVLRYPEPEVNNQGMLRPRKNPKYPAVPSMSVPWYPQFGRMARIR